MVIYFNYQCKIGYMYLCASPSCEKINIKSCIRNVVLPYFDLCELSLERSVPIPCSAAREAMAGSGAALP